MACARWLVDSGDLAEDMDMDMESASAGKRHAARRQALAQKAQADAQLTLLLSSFPPRSAATQSGAYLYMYSLCVELCL